jgi:ABC-type nitrate/sulfonate/bicarbonate transport system permease component
VSKFSILREFWEFLKTQKKWWLLPIAVLLVALGFVLATTQGSSLSSFIYTLF